MSPPTAQIEDIYPLTPAQQGILFHAVRDPESDVYFEQSSVTLEGTLDVPAFRRAWERVVERHAVLRSAFDSQQSDPLQIVHREVTLHWEQLDWADLPAAEQESQLEQFLLADRRRGFELSRPPLMRMTIIRCGERLHEFVWSHHHLLLDGWSSHLVQREVREFYEAFCRGEEREVARPPQFREYVAWLANRDASQDEAFWRGRLRGFTSPTRLPHRAEGPYTVNRITLSASATSALEAFARTNRLTLNSIVQGAWALLLSRYCDRDEVVFGAVFSGRPAELSGVASMAGVFINTLPVRVRLGFGETVRQWLVELQAETAAIHQRQFTPLAQIQPWSEAPKGAPLFESIIAFENYPAASPRPRAGDRGLVARDRRAFSKTNYPLTLVVAPDHPIRLLLAGSGRQEGTLHRLQLLLEGIPAAAERRLSELRLLTSSERHEILAKWNATSAPRPKRVGIHQLFEEQAARTPQALAISGECETLTYRELNARSNQVAHVLRTRGVGKESIVALCANDGAFTVAAVLGILKSGAAYLPVAADGPAQRCALMLRESAARCLLAERGAQIGALAAQIPVIWLDWTERELGSAPAENVPADPDCGDSLAYVIYTSGSTGKPKGVMITHDALVNRSTGLADLYALRPNQRMLRFVSLSFDASAEEIFPPLICGATIVWGRSSATRDPFALLEFASRWSVTILHLPTAYWRRLVDCVTSSLELPASLELTIVGGESPNWNEARMWRYFSSGSRLVHVYGPTEATITAAAYEVPAEAATGGGVPIGRAVSNTQLYVLDRDLGLQPPEVPGELYIGGESLARGYLNGPDLTAERFVPDPYSGQHGGRMYRTGDVARWSADGQVEFLGRRDREVKVRGYRIHPAEVEAALCLHSAVKECLVMTQKRSDTDELVAWVVPASDSQSGPRQIREFLCSKLPSWMTPSRIVFTDAFQRTSNGKIDRNAMAARDADIPPLLKDSRDPVEELIAAAWSEVLGIDDAAPDDSFFEFGGHSLSAMRVAAKLRRAFQIDVPLKWIFDRPTLRSLAREIRTALADSAVQAPDAPITPVSRDQWLPLSLGQERLWLLDLTLPGSPLFNMRFTAQLTGTLEEAALRQSVNEVVRRHESLRTRFAAVGDDVCQVISSEAAPPFLAVDLRVLPATAQPGEALRIVREQAAGSFNLAEDSPIRATLVRIDERDHVLLLVVHHIVCDGWSMDVLLSDLARCYNAYSAGRSPVLPPQPLQYADYAHWQRNWMETEAPRAHLDYWKETISPPLELLSLPRSSNTPAISELHMSSESLCLSPALTASLKRLSRRESATPFMTLLAAFKAMLSRYTPTPAVRVGVLSANRREGTEGMVGLFVNTLVLRTDLSGDPEFRKLLARVRETCLSAFAHDELPFDVLMYGLEREAGIRKKDAFEVMFVYQNSSGRSLELDGLAVLALTPEGIGDSGPVLTTADLVLIMQDSGPSLMAELKYKTNLFDPGTIAGMLHDLKRILERVIETPAARLADLAAPSAVPARARAAR